MMTPSIFGNDFFDDFWSFPFYNDKDVKRMEKKAYGRGAKNIMKTDIREHDTGYTIEVELPGFKKDEVKVSLEDGYLTINAAKMQEENEKDKATGKYIRQERFSGVCQRSFYVGEDLTEEDIKGEFKHGILKLEIPKKEAKPVVETKKYITIEG